MNAFGLIQMSLALSFGGASFYFAMDSEKAVQIMLAVHTQGKATCGIFTRDIAETKCHQVNEYARECEHPLMCDVDAAE